MGITMICDVRIIPPPLFGIRNARSYEVQSSSSYDWNSESRPQQNMVVLQLTLEGEGGFTIQGKDHTVGPGQAFVTIIPEAARYYYPKNGKQPWKLTWIAFTGDLSIQLWHALRNRFGPVLSIPQGTSAHSALLKLIQRVELRQFESAFDKAAEGYAFYLKLWRQLMIPEIRQIGVVKAAVEHLREHFQQATCVKQLAAQAGLSREHFSRMFVRERGVPPALYIRHLRVEYAASLLKTTKLPLKRIAMEAGFRSVRQLNQAFKQRFGIMPASSPRGDQG
jgi:AraC-like DNA-binding protein